MTLPEKQNQIVNLAEASKQTANYRKLLVKGEIIGGLFWKEYVQQLLNQPGCLAMRYYYGQDNRGLPTLILVGVNLDGNDIENGIILEVSPPCPPYCSNANSLNSMEV